MCLVPHFEKQLQGLALHLGSDHCEARKFKSKHDCELPKNKWSGFLWIFNLPFEGSHCHQKRSSPMRCLFATRPRQVAIFLAVRPQFGANIFPSHNHVAFVYRHFVRKAVKSRRIGRDRSSVKYSTNARLTPTSHCTVIDMFPKSCDYRSQLLIYSVDMENYLFTIRHSVQCRKKFRLKRRARETCGLWDNIYNFNFHPKRKETKGEMTSLNRALRFLQLSIHVSTWHSLEK